MSAQPEKILAIQFKYFGDTALMVPALRAIREHHPECALHALVPEEYAPLLQHLPWLTRLWPMPRARGRAQLRQTWPIIRALRAERFDRSVDFGGNDRGAILSRLIGAQRRLGWEEGGGFFGRKYCYNERIVPETQLQPESLRLAQILSVWQIPPPRSLELEIRADPALDTTAAGILPAETVLCHMASSQPSREWPVRHWAGLYQLALAAGQPLAFTTAIGVREGLLAAELKKIAPTAPVLPPLPELPLFIAVLRRAAVVISGDTGPLHLAAGLGVPTIALFGPSYPERYAPVGKFHRYLKADNCACGPSLRICQSQKHCLAAITPEQVFEQLKAIQAVRRCKM